MIARRIRFGVPALLALAFTIGCGRKGPPLPPLRPVPNRVSNLTARHVEDRVTLRFTLPTVNTDNSAPVAIESVEIYALSVPAGSIRPSRLQIMARDNLVGTVRVRLPAPADETKAAAEPASDSRPAPGDTTSFVDRIPPGDPKPLPTARGEPASTPPPTAGAQPPAGNAPAATGATAPTPTGTTRPPPAGATAQSPAGAAAPPALPAPPTRYYLLVGVSPRHRRGTTSELLSVNLSAAPDPPASVLAPHYDATSLTLEWTADKPGGSFHVYPSDAAGKELSDQPLTNAPVSVMSWAKPVEFGVERCFVVRAVRPEAASRTESAPAGPVCVTAVDTFPPPAPTGLDAIGGEGAVTLLWTGVQATDLAGYLVLRGEGAGDNMQPVTTSPIAETTYADKTAKPGVEYVYAVVAVDKASPPNRSAESNRAHAAARRP